MCVCVCVRVCMCACVHVYVYTHHYIAYHCSCVEQHEAATAVLNTKLKSTEEKLQSANKCEYNHVLQYSCSS